MKRPFLSMANLLVLTLIAHAAQTQTVLAQSGIDLYEQRRYPEAKRSLEATLRKNPRDSEAIHYLGRIAFLQRNVEEAVRQFEKVSEINPKHALNHFWLGRAYGQQALQANMLRQAVLAKKVRSSFERSVSLDPKLLEPRFGLIDFYLIAPGFMGGSAEKAKAQAAEIRKRDTLQGFAAAARIHRHYKKNDLVEREYLAALKAFPQKEEPHFWLGYYYQSTQQYKKAFDLFGSLLKIDPQNMGACYQIGRTAAFSGENLERGEECLRRYLQYRPAPDEPSIGAAHFRLGGIYEKKGQKDLARQEYETALELDPTLKDAAEALKKL